MCFGTQNRTLFAYIDREDGVYVLDPLTSNSTQLSSKGCLNDIVIYMSVASYVDTTVLVLMVSLKEIMFSGKVICYQLEIGNLFSTF